MKIGALDDYSLQDGIKQWVKTEDAKLFMAPKGAAGSGQKGSVTAPNGTQVAANGKEVDWGAFTKRLLSK